jgi:hypothetical protein
LLILQAEPEHNNNTQRTEALLILQAEPEHNNNTQKTEALLILQARICIVEQILAA